MTHCVHSYLNLSRDEQVTQYEHCVRCGHLRLAPYTREQLMEEELDVDDPADVDTA